MTMHALLAWFSLKAAPQLHDTRVYDALNDAAASMAGFRVVARQSLAVSKHIIADPADTGRINEGVDRMRTLMTAAADRAARTDRVLDETLNVQRGDAA